MDFSHGESRNPPGHGKPQASLIVRTSNRPDPEVGGRLATFRARWHHAPRWVYRVVSQGLRIPFLSPPPLAPWLRKNKVSTECLDLIQSYIEKGAIIQSQRSLCHTSPIFALPKSSGGHRLIFDLRSVNAHIKPLTTRFTGHQRLRQLLPQGAWMACLDIQDAYLHIQIHPSSRKYLCFEANGQHFEFICLPFGLNIAPLVFTSILRPIVNILRGEKINVLAYLDDLIVWDTSAQACEEAALRTASVLQEHWFLLNKDKSQPSPKQIKDWLGFRWNSITPSAALTPQNQEKIRLHCNLTLQKGVTNRQDMESLMGRLAFAAQLLPRTRYLKRSLTQSMRKLPRANALVVLTTELKTLLQTWAFTDAIEEEGILRQPPPDITIWTDASRQGWGFHDDIGNTSRGSWTPQQRDLHISALELLTIKFAIDSPLVKPNLSVAVFTDNVAAFYACYKQGSIRAPLMHRIYGDILKIVQRKGLFLLPRRIPGIRNVLADALSRPGPISTEWELDPRDFARIQHWAGPLQVDLMATPFNAKLPTFVCPFLHPKAAAVDALSIPWNRWQKIYLFPPSRLIDHLMPRIQTFKGTLILILNPRSSETRRTQLQSWATDSLQLRFPPFQKSGDKTHWAPWSTSAPWIALRFCTEHSPDNSVQN